MRKIVFVGLLALVLVVGLVAGMSFGRLESALHLGTTWQALRAMVTGETPPNPSLPPELANMPQAAGMPQPVGGTIQQLNGNSVTLRQQDGSNIEAQLTDRTIIQTMSKVSLSDIQLGDSTMIFGVRDGTTFRAAQVRVVHDDSAFMGGDVPVVTGGPVSDKAPPEPLYGSVKEVGPDSFVVLSRDGNERTTVRLSEKATIIRQLTISNADLKPGDELMAVAIKDGASYTLMQIMKTNQDLVREFGLNQ